MITWLLRLWYFGPCEGCGELNCPKVGSFGARRRMFAYCPTCMPELYGTDKSEQKAG